MCRTHQNQCGIAILVKVLCMARTKSKAVVVFLYAGRMGLESAVLGSWARTHTVFFFQFRRDFAAGYELIRF